MTDQNVINLGVSAKELLDSEAWQNVMNELKRDSFEKWSKTNPEDKDAREDLYYMQVALAHINHKLKSLVDNGKVEKFKAVQKEQEKQPQVTTLHEAVDE